ncbi:PAS domain-containing protein [Salinibius halmophilus]|uniref:PAS domain-containing protein n=1 Tax=Salinibius halmophilus TaxID=1853216 RepID=UPI000E66F34A|nr:PAS domain-containing protein [Salinibius halmophilus]
MTDQRAQWPSDHLIISKTDLKGKITYANRLFMQVSEMHEGQLLGKPHSVIRHPDMPRGVFRYMWQTLQKGEEFFGLVKNKTYTGKYYWVLANVTPNVNVQTGKINGYFSVRRQINESVEEVIANIYQEMKKIESAGTNQSIDDAVAYLMAECSKAGGYRDFVIGIAGVRFK